MVTPEVEFILRTFIPSGAIGVPYPFDIINGGDARESSFSGQLVPGADFSTSKDASFRTSQSVVLNFGSDGEPLAAAPSDSETSTTVHLSKDNATELEDRWINWCWHLNDGAEPVNQSQLDPETVAKPEVLGPLPGSEGTDFSVNFQLSAEDPLPPPLIVVFSSTVSQGRRASTGGGIDHLAIYGEIAAVVQDGLEAIKQPCNRGSARQPLALEPDRFRVGNLVAVVEAQKPAKAAAVEDLKLGLIIGQAVERPQYRTDCADINPSVSLISHLFSRLRWL